jgi:hypothetical protein
MVAASEELGRLGELPDVIVKGIQDERKLGKDERLRLTQGGDRLMIDHVEPKSLQDRAFTAHVVAPQKNSKNIHSRFSAFDPICAKPGDDDLDPPTFCAVDPQQWFASGSNFTGVNLAPDGLRGR